MIITKRRLKRIIRESLLRENKELKKLKKLFVSGIEHHAWAWELADTLGLAGQVEAMMRTDFGFLKKMTKLGQNITTDEQEDFLQLIEFHIDLGHPDSGHSASATVGPRATTRTRTGAALKRVLADSAFEMMKSGRWNKEYTLNLFNVWLSPEERQQLDWNEVASMTGVFPSLLEDDFNIVFKNHPDDSGTGVFPPLMSSNPSLHSALSAELDEISTMGSESDALRALIENMTDADAKTLGLAHVNEWDSMGYDWRDAVNDLTPDIAKKIAKKLGL